jgi:hypothetical protein
MFDESIVELSIKKVHPDPDNLKVHTEANIRYIQSSIERFGFLDPIGVVAHPDGRKGVYMIVEGHGRFEAAQNLELEKVPVIVLTLDEAERRGYGIAHNHIQQLTTMNMQAVASEFQRLGVGDGDHVSLGFSDEDVLFMPSGITAAPIAPLEGQDPFTGPDGNELQERGEIGANAGAWKEFIPAVHRSSLRFASDLSYNRFLAMLGHLRGRHPTTGSHSERIQKLLTDIGFTGEKTDGTAGS